MSDRSPIDRTIAERLGSLAVSAPQTAPLGLTEAVRLGRRSRARRARAGVLAAALVLVLVPLAAVTVGWPLLHSDQATPAASASPLRGAYFTQLATSPAGTHGMTGRWGLAFHDDGTLGVSAPPGYSGILTGFHYSRSGEAVRVDLFTQDLCADLRIGAYAWARTATGVRFSVVDDACAPRVAFLTGRTWTGTGTG